MKSIQSKLGKLIQLVLVIVWSPIFSQSILKDAELIHNSFNKDVTSSDYNAVLPILTYYAGIPASDSISFIDLVSKYKQNPYISEFLSQYKVKIEKRMQELASIEVPEDKVSLRDSLVKAKGRVDSIVIRYNSQRVLNKITRTKSLVFGLRIGTSEIRQGQLDSAIVEQKKIISELEKVESQIEGILKQRRANEGIINRLSSSVNNISIQNEIKSVINPNSKQFKPDYSSSETSNKINTSGHLQISGLTQSSLIDGTAIFIANRIKEEIKAEFINNFSAYIKNDKVNGGIRNLFPNTYQLLSRIDIYAESSYINLLRESFKLDLNHLIFNLPNYISHTTDSQPELKFLVLSTISSLEKINKGTNLSTALDEVYYEFYSRDFKPELKSVVEYIQILSRSLVETENLDGNRIWTSAANFSKMSSNRLHAQIFMGLVFQEILKVNDKYGSAPEVFVNRKIALSDHSYFLKLIKTFYSITQNVDDLYSALIAKRQQLKTITQEDLMNYQLSIIDFIRFSVEGFGEKLEYTTQNGNIYDFNEVLDFVEQFYISCTTSNYPSIVLSGFNLLSLFTGDSYTINNFLKYGSFMAEVSAAKNGEEVAKAIESVALPVGSYGLKRRNKFSLSINTYPGLLGGFERINSESDSSSFKENVGFTAPIGLSFNWAILSKKSKFKENKQRTKSKYYTYHSISTFVTIVDLGAPVLYRLTSGEGFTDEFKVQQFVSPGFSIVWGLPKSPLAILVGSQLTPSLRKIGEGDQKSVLRLNFAITFDIPIVNLTVKD